MQVILHIGSLKTGSTAIQSAVAAAREALKRAGIYVPDAGLVSNHHYGLACAFGFSDGPSSDNRETLIELRRELDEARPGKVLITSEHFDIKPSEFNVSRLREFFAADRVRVILYLRNQLDLAQSLYFEHLKWNGVVDFDTFVIRCLRRGEFDYYSKIQRWMSSGYDMTVFDFDLKKQALISEFWAAVSNDLGDMSQVRASDRVNESLSPEAMEYIRRVNSQLPNGPERRNTYTAVQNVLSGKETRWRRARRISLPESLVRDLNEIDGSNRRVREIAACDGAFWMQSLVPRLSEWKDCPPLQMDAFMQDYDLLMSEST